MKSNFVYPRINRFPLVGHDLYQVFIYFFVRKNRKVWGKGSTDRKYCNSQYVGFQSVVLSTMSLESESCAKNSSASMRGVNGKETVVRGSREYLGYDIADSWQRR